MGKWDKLRSAASDGDEGKLLDDLEHKVTHPNVCTQPPPMYRGVLDRMGTAICR